MKKKIIYIRLFSIIGIICILGFMVGVVVGLFKVIDREGYTNNSIDVHNNLGFDRDFGGRGGGSGSGSSGINGYDDGVAEKWGYGWGDNVVKQFLALQSTINPEYIFNVNMMQKYISKDEVTEFLANGKWNWSDETKKKYLEYVDRDPRSKDQVNPSFDMNLLQTVYSESAIKKLIGGQGCGAGKRNKIGVFIADSNENVGVLYEGRENDGSGIRTFGVNSGLLSNGYCCYDLM